eukprot:TRINITY_DN10089_c0_g2_i1.p1 TRINITY_DN10089_c0_g2~~TRINITY_DN10089_c0_g2_i1.p1  ORF type:complete len:458 (-),score=57.87 TRINITY_DN10089_c0_g2_i1:81-1454(-)
MAATKEQREFTWDELRKHNTAEDAYLAVRGKVYDVTGWMDKHPGGREVLTLNAGRDATQLFEAYHPLTVTAVLSKYEIGTLKSSEHPTFPPISPFYRTLKERVEKHFRDTHTRANESFYLMGVSFAIVAVLAAAHYYSMVLAENHFVVSLLLASVVGVCMALTCLIPVHEASHAAFQGRFPIVSRFFGAFLDYVNGCSYYMWLHQHFLGHHPYTNLSDVDPDVHTNDTDFRRIKSDQTLMSHYSLQKFYAPLVYGLLAVKFRISDVQMMVFSKTNGKIALNPPDTWHTVVFWTGKAFYFTYKFLLPMYLLNVSFLSAFILSFWADLISSWYLTFVFQVNHVVAPAVWPTVNKDTRVVDMDWAEMQVSSTIDYAHDSKLATFFSGALNYQVTHHLFPYISQAYYPEIAPIIRQVCKEFNKPYIVLPTFYDAFCAHLHYLGVMGNNTTYQASTPHVPNA